MLNIKLHALAIFKIVAAFDFLMNKSPFLPCDRAYKTKSIASDSEIKNLVILGFVIVNGLLSLSCFKKSGTTEPLEKSTFPYLIAQMIVFEFFDFSVVLANIIFSINILLHPRVLIG